jgi:hypothetical protein
MLSLAGRYDTAELDSGDEDFVYAVNSVAYKGCRVEVAGFRSNTAPKLIDVADCFIDLGDIAERVRKDFPHGMKYEDRELHVSQQPAPPHFVEPEPQFVTPEPNPPCSSTSASEIVAAEVNAFHPPIGSIMETNEADEFDQFSPGGDFIRVTDDQ